MDQIPPDVIDLSSWRQQVDFDLIAAFGVKGVIIRYTVNHLYADLTAMLNTKKAIEADLWVGAYANVHPRYDVYFQANAFLAMLHPECVPIALDCERLYDTHPKIVARVWNKWLDHVQSATLITPAIYTRKYWWEKHIHRYFRYNQDYLLWVAYYTTRPEPRIPNYWKTWDLWQFTNLGRVPGIADHFDFNWVNPNGRLSFMLEKPDWKS